MTPSRSAAPSEVGAESVRSARSFGEASGAGGPGPDSSRGSVTRPEGPQGQQGPPALGGLSPSRSPSILAAQGLPATPATPHPAGAASGVLSVADLLEEAPAITPRMRADSFFDFAVAQVMFYTNII